MRSSRRRWASRSTPRISSCEICTRQMTRERLYLFDTPLRDGTQTNGVDFPLGDKLAIARMLDELGLDYVEGGYPGANPIDTEFFSERPKLSHAAFTAFGMTRRPGRPAP